MNDKQRSHTSKFLSLILRHKPEEVGLTLGEEGWVDVNVLLTAIGKHGTILTFDELKEIVDTSDKKRFAFNSDFTNIRANQGHSVSVDITFKEGEPPEILYHGTPNKFIKQILIEGLKKMERHHVHLSADYITAIKVGERRGSCRVLSVDAAQMYKDGYKFYISENGVWLTDFVPADYLF